MADGLSLDLILMADDHQTVDSAAEQAQLAESHGFETVSMGETTGWNVVPVMAVLAERTDEITIADDVLSPYARSPSVYGQTALTMHDIADGRFRLGLGTSSPALAERWHSSEFEQPLRRLRETIDVIREVYEGGSVTYDGEIFEMGGLDYNKSAPENPPPVDVAALGSKATELTGRFADGWVPQLFTPEALADRYEDLERGADLGDRDAADVRVSPIVRTCVDEDPDRARMLARQMVSFLVAAYGPFYGQSVAEQGYEDEVAEMREAWEEKDTAAMADALHDEMLESLTAVGTPEMVRQRIETYANVEGVDAVRVGFVSGMSQEDKEQTLEALEPLT
jgi:coenzyme F420-dependent oxidoreductase